MKSSADLEAYFKRIGYGGPKTATLETLRKLQKKHTQSISFENLNPLLGIPVKLDLDTLQQKMVYSNRGGYCYEQNLLFLYVLETIGFKVKGLAARIRYNKDEDETASRSHMLLSVEVGADTYLADVGFGSQTLTGPLLLEPDTVQETPHESRRLIQENENFVMQAKVKNEWKSLYQFTLQEHYLVDYEVHSWYLCNHPESHFVNDLVAARPDDGRRYTLRDNVFSVYHSNGETEERELTSVKELTEVLEQVFLLDLPEKENINSTFSNLIDTKK